MRCPACYSDIIVTTAIELPDGEQTSQVIRAMKEAAGPVAAGLTAIAWMGAQLYNHTCQTFRCGECGHTFDS